MTVGKKGHEERQEAQRLKGHSDRAGEEREERVRRDYISNLLNNIFILN